jgi:hypothetical protein
MEQAVRGRFESDLLTEVTKDLEIDSLDFEAAMIFDRPAGPQ